MGTAGQWLDERSARLECAIPVAQLVGESWFTSVLFFASTRAKGSWWVRLAHWLANGEIGHNSWALREVLAGLAATLGARLNAGACDISDHMTGLTEAEAEAEAEACGSSIRSRHSWVVEVSINLYVSNCTKCHVPPSLSI